MTTRPNRHDGPGPMNVDQLRIGDRYELSNGHPLYVLPTGGEGARGTVAGVHVLDTDPAVETAGIDAGFALDDKTLRAPDIAVGGVADVPGWIPGTPQLAVEYAGTGQDEAQLTRKIAELLERGTQLIWVVRLVGPRRVEIHQKGKPVRIASVDDELEAPGILKNRVPVRALYDRQAAHELTLKNLLERKGYADLDAVLAAGRTEGLAAGRTEGLAAGRTEGEREARKTMLRQLLTARGLLLDGPWHKRIATCQDLARLASWFERALTATCLDDLEP